MTAQTRTAGRGGNNAASFYENVQIAFFDTFPINLLGSGNDDGSYIFMNLVSLQNFCRCYRELEEEQAGR